MRMVCICALVAAGCVRYTKEPIEWGAVSAQVEARSPGALDYNGALAYAREHNPELKRLRLEAEAAGLDVPPTSIGFAASSVEKNAVGFVDPLALLKLGPRGARARVAKEREDALFAGLRERDLEVAASIAEAYLVERVLRAVKMPEVAADPEQFRAAGLASSAEVARVDYARDKERAERFTVEALRRENLSELRRLLGVSGTAAVEIVTPADEEFPPLPMQADLFARPDLATALEQYHVADAEFRAAVLDQYPVLSVGPAFNWDLVKWGVLVPVRIPVGAGGPARAAGKRREAARLAAEEALVRAQQDVAQSRARYEWTAAQERAARSGARAAHEDLRVALAHIEVSPDAFGHLAKAAPDAVERMAKVRTASVDAARARVALARAYAWPHVRGDR